MDPNGYTNRDCEPWSPSCSAKQLTYDLRRLRAHGLITRRAGTHRYEVTDTGLHHALFLTRAHQRLLRTGLARLTDPVPSPLNSANRAYQTSTTPPANPA